MIRMTYELAHAIAMDDANRNAKKHGRNKWNRDDAEVARKVEDNLWWYKLLPKELW